MIRINIRLAIVRGVLALGVGLVFVAVYRLWIVPLETRENDSRRRLVELGLRVEIARTSIDQVRKLEQETAEARRALNGLHGDHPEGSALVRLPQRVKEHFTQLGLAVAVIRLNTVQEEAGLPGYARAWWSVGFPIESGGNSIPGLLLAVAQLEEQDRFLQVIDFTIRQDVENPLLLTAAINLSALIQK